MSDPKSPSTPGGTTRVGSAERVEYGPQRAPEDKPLEELRDRGTRAPEVVRYAQSHWIALRDRDARGAPQAIDLFLKLQVARGQGEDGEGRRAGIVYKLLGSLERVTQEGNFASRVEERLEEWHVRVCLQASSPGVVPFYVWYEDGRGRLYYDDNARQTYVVVWKTGFEVLRHDYEGTTIEVTDKGVYGVLTALVADLEYHKDLELVWTTDGWKTTGRFGTGESLNQWHWVKDGFEGYQHWQIELAIPGTVEEFEYAIVYRHGGVEGATASEFWADNGQRNFKVRLNDGSRR